MRIALDHTSEIGIRAGRLLLGEPSLDELGIVRRDVKDRDTRLVRVDRVTEFDAVVTDDPQSTILAEAFGAGVPCVLWADDASAVFARSAATGQPIPNIQEMTNVWEPLSSQLNQLRKGETDAAAAMQTAAGQVREDVQG